jgi:hypothetical protein
MNPAMAPESHQFVGMAPSDPPFQSDLSLLPRLTVMSDSLRVVFAAEADGRLLAVGDRLSAAIAVFAQLTSIFQELRESLGSEELRASANRLKEVGRDVSAMVSTLAREHEVLTRLVHLNGAVGKRIASFRKTARAISMLSVSAQVAAASIDLNAGDIASLTHQFKDLAETANSAIEASAHECDTLRALLDKARTAHVTFESEHGERLFSIAQQLGSCVDMVDRQRLAAAEALKATGERSQSISDQIGVVIMALQISDITRQRIEHVSDALDLLVAGLDGNEDDADSGPEWSAGLADDERASVAASVCRLQNSQLAHARRDYDRDVGRAAASLRKLVDDAAMLVHLGQNEFGAGDARYGSFLGDLASKLGTATALIGKCQEARARVDEDILAASDMLRGLLGQLQSVQAIQVNMRLVSLNTTFQCERLGAAGRVLAVIARQLSIRANWMVGDINTLIPILEEIATTAQEFERDRHERSGQRMVAVERTIETALGALRASGEQVGNALSTLGREGTAVGRVLSQAIEGMVAFEEVGRLMYAADERLSDLAQSIEERPEHNVIVEQRTRLFPTDRYTMASERAIHDAVATSGGGTPVAAALIKPSSATPAEQTLDDIFF